MADGAAASGLRDDRNVCQLCGALENLSLCGGCRVTWYCCKDHQRAHWKQHKGKCSKGSSKQTNHKNSVGPEVESSSSKDVATASCSAGTHLLEPVPNQIPLITSKSVAGKQNLEHSKETSVTGTGSSTTSGFKTNCDSFSPVSVTTEVNSTESEVGHPSSRESDSSQGPAKSKSPKGKRASGGGASNVKKDNNIQLPAIPEESNQDERYFLDTRPFSQTIQLSQHTDRARQSASTMVPKGDTMNSNAYVDILKSRFAVIADYVVTCLNKYNICVIDGFLGEVTGQEILNEVKQLHSHGVMQKGQLVLASSASDTIRGDVITWIDARGAVCENIQYLVSCMDAVVKNCSALMEGYTINERTKAMVACYPGKSSGYVRHVDNPNEDGRCMTCIYYLNQNWDVRTDGGMLRIYPEGTDTVANIEPTFDRLLFFWSDRRNPHEVLPAMKERYAITVWYYEAEERARALKKFKGEVAAHPKKQAVPLFRRSPDSDS